MTYYVRATVLHLKNLEPDSSRPEHLGNDFLGEAQWYINYIQMFINVHLLVLRTLVCEDAFVA